MRSAGLLAICSLCLIVSATCIRPTGTTYKSPRSASHRTVFPQLLDELGHPTAGNFADLRHPSANVSCFLERELVVDLEPSHGFVSPHFAMHSYGWGPNESRTLHVHPDGPQHTDCFYVGRVRGELNSKVVVSLCRGMMGYIHTYRGLYLIEPQDGSVVHLQHPPHFIFHYSDYTNNATCSTKESSAHHEKERLRRKRRSYSTENHIEVLVATDSRMLRYHNNDRARLKDYVLILMAAVAHIYKDPSIGNLMNIAVVKFVILDEEAGNEIISPSASKTLRSFCRWQQEQNHHDDSNPHHHDTAILLTREDLCRLPKTCDTLGLAQSGMICDFYSSCSIVEDNGLSAAFTIAHELGHVLNIPHDDDQKCARYHMANQRLHVMARMLDYNSHPWSWSACSRYYLTAFLDSGYGSCLQDKPTENLLTDTADKQPGEEYGMDKQCELVFGSRSKICPYMPVCKRLWCTMQNVTPSGCRTQHMPWADGTICGTEAHRCHQGECVLRSRPQKPQKVDGEWGPWQGYGQCSRTCGGGVRSSWRECDSPRPAYGGQYCIGKRVKYQSCNSEACPPGSIDFREEQCASFNGKTFNFPGLPSNVKWTAHYSGIPHIDKCKLYCRVVGTGAYYPLKEKVIDGTPCSPENFDICVNGVCKPAGCDYHLNSTKKLDMCGICGGNGTTCKTISGHFNNIRFGYNPVAKIPPGASNIDVKQYGFQNSHEDDNYLALKGDQDYILNGNLTVSMFRKTITYGGSVIEYSGSSSAIERINATKPLGKELQLFVLTVGELRPPDISYQYTVSIDENDNNFYVWHLDKQWTKCSHICQGHKYRNPVCIRKSDETHVSESRCASDVKPSLLAEACNMHCVLRWKVMKEMPCSVQCGTGVKNREIKCSQEFDDGQETILYDEFCSHLGPKPPDEETCERYCPKYHWEFGAWGPCSKTCGEGEQTRSATCVDENQVQHPDNRCDLTSKVVTKSCTVENCPPAVWKYSNWTDCSVECGTGIRSRGLWCEVVGLAVAAQFCNDPKPEDTEICDAGPCFDWEVGPDGPCSVTCGRGVARKILYCRSHKGTTVDQHLCSGIPKPEDSLTVCSLLSCALVSSSTTERNGYNMFPGLSYSSEKQSTFSLPKARWKYEEWAECTAIINCTDKKERRSITCVDFNNRPVPDAECGHLPSPAKERDCKPCTPFEQSYDSRPLGGSYIQHNYKWITGQYGQCSRSCGGGYQKRQVVCKDSFGGKSTLCPLYDKPEDKKTCHTQSCPYWKTFQWTQCDKSCGGGQQTREVVCLDHKKRRVSDEQCRMLKPDSTRSCNMFKCTASPSFYKWNIDNWSPCSVSCGYGYRTRKVECVDANMVNVPTYKCEGDRPAAFEECRRQDCPRWELSSWSQCSAVCGNGTQKRVPKCMLGSRIVPNSDCKGRRPSIQMKPCQARPCNFRWKKKRWSQCTATCGGGSQTRKVYCVDKNERPVGDRWCEGLRRPKVYRHCATQHCSFIWRSSNWEQCSRSCDEGIQMRTVSCHKVNAYGWIDPEPVSESSAHEDGWCNKNEKPATTRSCNLGTCIEGAVWKAGPWLACSVPCGTGRQRRRVRCYDLSGKKIPKTRCSRSIMPRRRRKCNLRPCAALSCQEIQRRGAVYTDGHQKIFVRGKEVTVFCARMNTSSPQEYISLPSGENNNFSEIYSKRLLNPETCPYGGLRNRTCDCFEDFQYGQGLTRFSKIAFNITKLTVALNDFSYGTIVHGKHTPYAESGDCYSSLQCPQGRFSVNLLGTGFIVSPKTKWITHGLNASSKIHRRENGQVVEGMCGGYCGKCFPDSRTGLLLDVLPP